MILKIVKYCNEDITIACDGKCSKAWGANNRPKAMLSDDDDDYEFLSDDELGEAPADPGTYEGGHAKPRTKEDRLNKWCARECERSVYAHTLGLIVGLPDFDKRIKNKMETAEV